MGTIAQGSQKNTYQLESEQFDYVMADSTREAQIEEQICSLQTSQAKLKVTSERHVKLLIEVLQHLHNLRTTESSTRKTSQADHTSVEPGLWCYSICTNGAARATPFKFDRPSLDDSTLENSTTVTPYVSMDASPRTAQMHPKTTWTLRVRSITHPSPV